MVVDHFENVLISSAATALASSCFLAIDVVMLSMSIEDDAYMAQTAMSTLYSYALVISK